MDFNICERKLGFLYLSLAGLYFTIRELQYIQYFISVFFEILNVTIRSVFINPGTY